MAKGIMDFRSLLADMPSAAEKDLLVEEVIQSEAHFNTLLHLALKERDPVAWRACWVLDGSDEQRPGLARKHISRIVQALSQINSKGTLRSLLRLLSRYDIPEKDQGRLIDLCFSYLVSELYPVAVKVHAMQIIYNHVLLYPELKHELITVIKDQVQNNSVGFKSRGNILIKQMEKL
jgi:hypothetical protein